jgi:hypothetical protein
MTNPTLFVLKRDVTLAHCWPNQGGLKWPATFPKGTPVQRVGADWAIRDEKTVAALTGNAHDARHKYVWVKEEDCE